MVHPSADFTCVHQTTRRVEIDTTSSGGWALMERMRVERMMVERMRGGSNQSRCSRSKYRSHLIEVIRDMQLHHHQTGYHFAWCILKCPYDLITTL